MGTRTAQCPVNTAVSSLCFHRRAASPSRAPPSWLSWGRGEQVPGSTHIFAVFRLGEVDQVIVVHVLGVEQVAVLLLAQVFWVNPIGPEELLVRNAEGLPDGLCDQLGLEQGIGRDSGQSGNSWLTHPGQFRVPSEGSK